MHWLNESHPFRIELEISVLSVLILTQQFWYLALSSDLMALCLICMSCSSCPSKVEMSQLLLLWWTMETHFTASRNSNCPLMCIKECFAKHQNWNAAFETEYTLILTDKLNLIKYICISWYSFNLNGGVMIICHAKVISILLTPAFMSSNNV